MLKKRKSWAYPSPSNKKSDMSWGSGEKEPPMGKVAFPGREKGQMITWQARKKKNSIKMNKTSESHRTGRNPGRVI